jgi:hypothetical protein
VPAAESKAPEPMLLELLLDGEWTLDLPTVETGPTSPSASVAAGSQEATRTSVLALSRKGLAASTAGESSSVDSKPGNRAADASRAAITVEKGLEDWITQVGGPDRPLVAGDSKRTVRQPAAKSGQSETETEAADPATVPLALSLSIVGVGSVAAGSVWQGPIADRPVPQVDVPVVPDTSPGSDDETKAGAPEPKPIVLPDIPGAALQQLEADADELIKRLAPFHRAIEIGGFTFPSGIEPDRPALPSTAGAVPTVQPRAPEPVDQLSPPIRVEPLPLSGGLDFGSGTAANSGGSKHSNGDHPPPRLPPIAPPPPQTEGRLSDLLIRAHREATSASRPAPADKAEKAPPGKDAAPTSPASDSKPAPAASSAPTVAPSGPAAPRRPAIIAEAPASKAATLDPPAAAPRRIDHIMVDLKDDTGDHGRLRLALSGSTVRATIMPNDPDLADRLTAGIRELRQNLEERGFPEPRVTVQPPKSDVPLGGHLFGRDVVTEIRGPAAKADSQGPRDEDPRGRWQADQSERERRDQRHQNRPDREPQEEGRTE